MSQAANTGLSRLSTLRNRHAGERVVLVANGPSLNCMNLDFLKKEVVIGLNKIFLGFARFDFYPRYFVVVNGKVIEQAADTIRSLNCVKFIGSRGHHLLDQDALTYHINTRKPAARFNQNISHGVHEGWTVTYAALQVAYHLGFREVVIIGLDHRYAYTGQPNEARLMDGPDPNHFVPDYFSGQVWQNPDLAHSEESYHIARSVFEQNGRRIIDATLDGACSVFEKADYRQIFGLRK